MCTCGSKFSVEHALSCAKGGFPSIRHNEIRNLTATLLTEVCHDVCIEPGLQPVSNETLTGASANRQDGARLDIAASGFWGGTFERTFFDVRVFNPHAPSNRHTQLRSCYRKHEQMKKRAYEQRIREVEHASFTPLVMDLRTKPAHSTKDWPPCSPLNGITPTAAHCAGCVVVWLSPSYVLLSSPSEELDHRVDMPSELPQRSTSLTPNRTFHLMSNMNTNLSLSLFFLYLLPVYHDFVVYFLEFRICTV